MSVTAYVGYPVLSELLLRGRSVGRVLFRSRVVRDDGGPAHLRQSLIRAVMAMLEIWSTAGTLALTSSVIDRRSRRIGDLLAGTMVIQERMRTIEPRRPAVPVDLQQWAGSADVGRHPVTLMADIRDQKSTRLNSSQVAISYAVFCLKKKNNNYKELMHEI